MIEEYETVHSHDHENRTSKPSRTLDIAFWLLGLFNNSSYVIMIASAKTISEGGTGLVFLANVVPSMLIKLTAPYWFDHVSYETRMILAFGCMVCSFGLVATLSGQPTSNLTTTLELVGVAIGSAQGGLGESSLLAAAGKCDVARDGRYVSFFASGTGLAGVFGFLWKFVFNEWLGQSMSTTLWLAQSLALLYIGIFWKYLHPFLNNPQHDFAFAAAEEQQPLEMTTFRSDGTAKPRTKAESLEDSSTNRGGYEDPLALPYTLADNSNSSQLPQVHEMDLDDRIMLVLSLWPYIIPLFTVYAAEYSLQAGTWTAIGFPVSSKKARDEFYEYSNWMYQAGVFVSRSSGVLGTAPMLWLWIMPALQVLNVAFFAIVAALHFWYSYSALLPICFYVGLLGGAVYAHGYLRICADFNQVDRREFALAATSVAESLGIVFADVLGLFIQSCLYQTNDISGAMVSCPIPARRR